MCTQNNRARAVSGRQLVRPGIRTVLMDIEGTICSISFVKEKLYPYSLEALPEALRSYYSLSSEEERRASPLAEYIDAFPSHIRVSQERLTAHVHELVSQDIKDSALKKLQGYLWRSGFESGKLSTPLFQDVIPKWKLWKGIRDEDTANLPVILAPNGQTEPPVVNLAIYSSGSVEAQKMLLEHVGKPIPSTAFEQQQEQRQAFLSGEPAPRYDESDVPARDFTSLIGNYFDTVNAGSKVERDSYMNIAADLGNEPHEILFLSDNSLEIRAALQVGIQAVLVERPGNAPLTPREEAGLFRIQTFDQILLC